MVGEGEGELSERESKADGLAIQPRGAQSVWRGKVVAHILGRQQAPGKMPAEDDPQPLTRDEGDGCRLNQTQHTQAHRDRQG